MGPRHFLKQNDYNFKRAGSDSEERNIFPLLKNPLACRQSSLIKRD